MLAFYVTREARRTEDQGIHLINELVASYLDVITVQQDVKSQVLSEPYLSHIPPLYLAYISPVSRLYLPCISPISPQYLAEQVLSEPEQIVKGALAQRYPSSLTPTPTLTRTLT